MSGRVLFVSDDAGAHRAFRAAFAPVQRDWEVTAARGGADALLRLERGEYDALVAEAQLAGTGCAEVLLEVRRRHPPTARIVLADIARPGELVHLVALAHRVLPSTCAPAELYAAVHRGFALRALLGNPALASVVGRLASVPTLSAHYARIADELMMPEYSLAAVGELVAQDPGIAARLLQMANSALVGLRKPATTPGQAVRVLGADLTRTLVLAADLFSRYNPNSLRPFSIETLWDHSQKVAELAGLIATDLNAGEQVARESALAGLFHDIGKLALASQLAGPYKEVMMLMRADGLTAAAAERRVLGTTHAEVGAYLLGLWGLPDALVEAVAWHHEPGACPGTAISALTAVHAADALLRAPDGAKPDAEYLARLGLSSRWEEWGFLRDRPRAKE
ncbi:MAG: HDOD domain-containing protein [Planctomycetes bacterium]|nr:HDOD domain-containing protein [Planctomycetota bacterium]